MEYLIYWGAALMGGMAGWFGYQLWYQIKNRRNLIIIIDLKELNDRYNMTGSIWDEDDEDDDTQNGVYKFDRWD